MESFAIAPMDRLFRVLTALLLGLPALFVVLALTAPWPLPLLFGGVGAVVGLLYAWIWFYWRPTQFRLEPAHLHIEFPRRQLVVELSEVASVRVYDSRQDFVKEWGAGIRIGAGGLWGAFGWLKTPKGLLQMYITRNEQLVVIEFTGRKPLLITPEDADRFVAHIHS